MPIVEYRNLTPRPKPKIYIVEPARAQSTIDKPARINPVDVMRSVLCRRVEERNGDFWLDGKPANMKDCMRAANKVLVARGVPQIVTNPTWRVDA